MHEAADVIAKRFTAEIVAPSNSYNGGRLSGQQATGLAHLAVGTLLSQGYAIVKLPEPDQIDPDGCVWVSDSSDAGTVGVYPGADLPIRWGTWEWTPDQARDVAAQWLGAANEADPTWALLEKD